MISQTTETRFSCQYYGDHVISVVVESMVTREGKEDFVCGQNTISIPCVGSCGN